MNAVLPSPAAARPLPRVTCRAAVGAALVLLVLHTVAVSGRDQGGRRATAEQAVLRLDPGIATREELMLLPRIGPALADYIIEYRQSVQPAQAFRCADDLDYVYRIGPATVERLRPYLRFQPSRSGGLETGAP